MKKLAFLVLTVLCFSVVTVASDDDVTVLTASLRGVNEVPAANSDGSGTFRAIIHEDGTITFTETFNNLTGSPLVSHIHFGEIHVAGGVMIFLCGGGGQPACPAVSSGTIDNGTIAAANVVGPTGQGITAGDLVSALRAIRQGAGYVNIHTTKFPGGEIRGQVIVHHGDEEGGDK
ncbi:MAG TPA: CHRD domain-containing protein [Candidatus Acidoferrales bacterium]